jgi:hypothetical protein
MHIITIAIGKPYRKIVLTLLEGLRKYNGIASVRCISDAPIENCETIIVSSEYAGFESRHLKTRLHRYARQGLNLFLDADVEALGPSDGIWQELSDHDFALLDENHSAPLEHAQSHLLGCGYYEEYKFMRQYTETGTPYYNSGIILWRHSKTTRDFFEAWHHEWSRFRRLDQPALYRAIVALKPRIKSLDPQFHATPLTIGTTKKPVFSHQWVSSMPDFSEKKSLIQRLIAKCRREFAIVLCNLVVKQKLPD